MDKQSRTISVKVNGTEAKYEEKKKDEFDWMVVESERPKTLFRFKIESSVYGKIERSGNTLIAIVATAIIIGTAFGMGMLQLLKGQGATGGSEEQLRSRCERKNQRWVERQNKHQHQKRKNKSTDRNVIRSNEIIFVQEESILLKKRDRPLLKSGKVMEV